MTDPMDIQNLAKAASEQLKEVLSQDIIVQQQARIEELEAENKELERLNKYWREDSSAGWDKCEENRKERDALKEAVDEVTEYAKRHETERDTLAYRIEELETKLAKMQRSRDRYREAWETEKSRAALAELKGQNDE